MEKKSFKRRIRNGGKVSIITIPKLLMESWGLVEGELVEVSLSKIKK